MKEKYYLAFENDVQRISVQKVADTRHTMFYVQFENGYANVFFTDIETGQWLEQDLGDTALARSVGQLVNHHQENTVSYLSDLNWFEPSGRTKFRFGYIKRKSGDTVFYDIYHSNKRFMFTLIRDADEGWEIPFNYNYNGWHFNIAYFNDIAFLIELNQL